MVGIVFIAHCPLADAFYKTLQLIGEDIENFCTVQFDLEDNPDEFQKKISNAIQQVNRGKGVILLTDMFGGTPSNLSLSFLEDGKIEVITGVNLPMLVRLASSRREQKNLTELAMELKSYGQKNICLASEILRNGKK